MMDALQDTVPIRMVMTHAVLQRRILGFWGVGPRHGHSRPRLSQTLASTWAGQCSFGLDLSVRRAEPLRSNAGQMGAASLGVRGPGGDPSLQGSQAVSVS